MPDFTPMLALWHRSWSMHGWKPIVLGMEDARAHPDFLNVLCHVDRLPTINPKQYTVNDFLRWLAMDQLEGGGLHVDSDVINYGFTPDLACESLAKMQSGSHRIILYDFDMECEDRADRYYGPKNICPSMVGWPASDRSQSASRMIEAMKREDHIASIGGQRHSSDQLFFNRVRVPVYCVDNVPTYDGPKRVVKAYGGTGWEEALCVHYATSPVFALHGRMGKDKFPDIIQRVRPVPKFCQ